MATVRDKVNAGRNHLRHMLSAWLESSQHETGTWSNSASMVGQAQPETQVRENATVNVDQVK